MTLHLYLARRFAASLLAVLGIFVVLTFLVEFVEQARRYGSEVGGLGQLAEMTLLRLPQSLYQIVPLIVIIASLAYFLALARTSELVAIRGAGRSAIASLLSPVIVALLLGGASVAVLNPLVAATLRGYEARIGAMQGSESVLAFAGDGLWLRQGNAFGQTVIHAEASNLDGTELGGVTFLMFGPDGLPQRRIAAPSARLADGAWEIRDAKLWPLREAANPEAESRRLGTLSLPSDLTADEIRNSFGAPASVPIWQLPDFIARLNAAGFTARRHEVFLQSEIATPLFLVAMVLIAAAFTMRHQRSGRTGVFVLTAVLLSFGAYFLRNFAQILGENGQISAYLAAWGPPLATIGLVSGLLLHLEDG